MRIVARLPWARAAVAAAGVVVGWGGTRAEADPIYTVTAVGQPVGQFETPKPLWIRDDGYVGDRPIGGMAGDYRAWERYTPGQSGTTTDVMIQKGDDPARPIASGEGGSGSVHFIGLNSSGIAVASGGPYASSGGFLYDYNAPQDDRYMPMWWITQAAESKAGSSLQAWFTLGGINDAGQIIGGYQTSTKIDHAFLTTLNGPVVDLNDLIDPKSGWVLTWATGINNRGQIVGYGTDPSGNYRGFELTPVAVPEPGTLAVFAALGLAFGWRQTRMGAGCRVAGSEDPGAAGRSRLRAGGVIR